MDSIVMPKAFDINKLSYGAVKTLDSGGKTIYISYDGKPFVFQTPEMVVPFGMSKWEGDGKSADKFTIEFSFKGAEEKPSLKRFKEMLTALDEKLVNDATTNSMAWLKKKYTNTEVVQALYTPIYKMAKDKQTGETTDKYPATFRVTLPYRNEKFTCEVYDKHRNLIDLSNVDTKGSRMSAIVTPTFWVAGGRFGCSFRVVQLRVQPPAALRGFAFQEDEGEVAAAKAASKASSSLVDERDDTLVDSSEDGDHSIPPEALDAQAEEEEEVIVDEDEDDDAIDAPPPPPPPPPQPKPTATKSVKVVKKSAIKS